MSLRRALERLPGDRVTDNAVREVLKILRVRVGLSFSVSDLAGRLGLSEPQVASVLSALADSFVVERDGSRFVWVDNPIVELEVERFMQRADSQKAFVQTNVAKFRDRYGYR